MTEAERKAIFKEFAELESEFRGETTPYARAYRAAMREARNVISQFTTRKVELKK